MKRNLTITGRLACILFALALAWACDEQPDKARKPKVVRKKITVAAKPPSQARKGPSKSAKGKAPTPQPRSEIAAAKPPRSKAATQKAPTGQAAAVAQSAMRPKADIDRQPVPSKPADAIAQKTGTQTAKRSDTETLPAAGPVKTAALPKTKPSEVKPGDAAPGDQAKPKADKPAARKTRKKGKPREYNPKGKTDPFKPIFAEKPKVTRQLRPTRTPRTPLERIALSQLKLTAIILAPSGNRALVQEATGKGYVIQNGTYIGKNSGKVVEIKKDRVIIEEEFEDVLGKLTRRKQQLKLPKPAGGK